MISSFVKALVSFPPWLVRLLIDYFAGLDFDDIKPVLEEHETTRTGIVLIMSATKQAFLGALGSDDFFDSSNDVFPGIRGVKPDIRNLSNFIVNIELMELDADIDIDSDEETYPLRVAIYNLRPTLFQHVLPFERADGLWIIGPIYCDEDGKFWLAQIASAERNGGDDRPNPFGIIYWHTSQRREFRNEACERLRLFRQAFDQIHAEGLHELAGAWWAFFIVSQAFLYGHTLGLYPDELRTVATVAEIRREHSISFLRR